MSVQTLNLRKLLICFCLLATMPVCSQSALAQDEAGLQYLFREAILNEPPFGLQEDDFAQLDDRWNEWSATTQDLLGKLYGFDPLTLEDQQQLLADLSDQLDWVYDALYDPEQRENYPGLVDLEGKISRRLSIYSEILELYQSKPEELDQLQPLLVKLLKAIERYESDDRYVDVSLKDPKPPTVQELLTEMESIAGEKVASLVNQIRINYYNFNFRTFVSEPFADYAFYECRRECGPVCDFILGARVTGSQRTKSGVYIDFLPSNETAKFAIRINGNTKTNTKGVTDQATIFTYGNHYFSGKKVMHYDGYVFKAYAGSLGVNANNTVKSAQLNRRGIIAKLIGDKIAYEKAVEKTPETERIAAYKLRRRVLPQFNDEIEDTFGELNDRNESLRDRMEQFAIAPNQVLARTDDDELRTAERLMNPGQLAADRATTVFNSPTGMTVHIHESWVNNALAFETLDLKAGEQLKFNEFSDLLSNKFIEAFKIDRDEEEPEPSEDRIIVYGVDPLHVQFDSGLIKVILRVGLKAADRENPIAIRRVEIPLILTMEEDKIRLQVDTELGSDSTPLDTTDENYRRGEDPVIADRITSRFQERLAEESFKRNFVIKADDDDNDGKEIPVRIESINTINGWLIVTVQPDDE